MSTKDSQVIFEKAQQCYKKEYWSDALHHLDELSCDMMDNKDVMYMRALCLARMGRTEESELLCDQLDIVMHDQRGIKLKEELKHAKRDEKEKPIEKKTFKIPTFVFPVIIGVVVIAGAGVLIKQAIIKAKNHIPEAVAFSTAPDKERSLSFGNELGVGEVYSRPWHYDVTDAEERTMKWKSLGQASGDILIPLGHEIQLGMPNAGQLNLAVLRYFKSSDIQSLNFESSAITDEDLDNIDHLSGLRDLVLSETQITGAGFAKLRRMTSLWYLSIAGINPGAEGWGVISSMPYLRELIIDRCNVSDVHLIDLCSSAPSIQFLSLDENTDLTDASIGEIEKLQSLRHIFLSYTGITDAGIARIQSIDSVERIYLEGTGVTDACVRGFTKMRSLKTLSLSRTQITDASLDELMKISGLQKLDISECPFLTEAAIVKLREALPNCDVDTTGNVTKRPAMWDEPA